MAEQVRAIASEALGVNAEVCRLENGGVVANGQRLTFGQIIQLFFRDAGGELIGHGYQRPATGRNALGATASFWEIGLGAAVVAVDRETGAITLRRYVSLSDPGRAINPAGVEGQDLGGAMQGLGPTLFEAMVYDDGQLVNGSMIDYRLPLFSDLPPAFDALIIEGGGGPGPHGAKGVAEGSIITVAPALANAVFDATGIRLRDLPLTPERVWRALRDTAPVPQRKGDGPMKQTFTALVAVSALWLGTTLWPGGALWLGSGVAWAQAPKIKVGRTTGASGFHLPTYVAMDRGLFKAEGLDAEFVNMTAGELARAAVAKEVDFAPVPGASAEAMLKGAPLVFVVGESLVSQWTLTTAPGIKSVEDLRGKTLGLGRPGSADYGELVVVLAKFFKMEAGRDYKIINFRGEPERVAAIIAGSIQGAALSFPHAARAEAEGLKILVKAGDHLPRLGGTISTHKDTVRDRRDAVRRFIRAIARSADYIRTEKTGTLEVIQKHFQLDGRVAEGFYNQIRDKFAPQIPKDLFRQLFDSVATPELGWPKDKALPDVEQFVARDLLASTLRELGKPVNE